MNKPLRKLNTRVVMIACEVCRYGYGTGDDIKCLQNCDTEKAGDCLVFEVDENLEGEIIC